MSSNTSFIDSQEQIPQFSAVIFDMDGLLVDSEPFWQQAEMLVFKTVGVELTLENCLETTGLPTKDVMNYWYQKQPWTGKSIEQVEDEVLQTAADLIGANAEAMPGLYEVLAYCKANNLKVGLASASPMVMIEIVLNRLKIKEYFDFYHSATLEKHNKPFPDVYLAVAQKLGFKPQNCLVFEDSTNGIRAAKAAGCFVVAVPAHHEYDDPKFGIADQKIKSLYDYKTVLAPQKTY